MRIFCILLFFWTSNLNAQDISQTQSNNASLTTLQTKMDASLSSMIEVIFTSLLQRVPGATETSSLKLNPTSTTSQLQGEFLLDWLSPESVSVTASGKVNFDLIKTSEGGLNVRKEFQVIVSNADFVKSLQIATQLFSKGQIPEDPVQAVASFKNELLIYLESLMTTQPVKKKQRFGSGGKASTSEQQLLPPEKIQILKDIVSNSLNISDIGGAPTIELNAQFFDAMAENENSTAHFLSFSGFLDNVQLQIQSDHVVVTILGHFQVDPQVLNSYDSYLSNKQNAVGGLTSMAELIQKIGPWLVGLCTTEDYSAICVDQLLYGCTRNVESVDDCVREASTIQAARSARENGDSVGVISNGAVVVKNVASRAINDGIERTGQAINDGIEKTGQKINDVIDDLFGTKSNTPVTEPVDQ